MGIDKSEYDVDFRERKEYLSAFFSSLREAGTYMSSENLRVAIESLNMTLSGVKKKEEEEIRRIRMETERKEAERREELLARVRAKAAASFPALSRSSAASDSRRAFIFFLISFLSGVFMDVSGMRASVAFGSI